MITSDLCLANIWRLETLIDEMPEIWAIPQFWNPRTGFYAQHSFAERRTHDIGSKRVKFSSSMRNGDIQYFCQQWFFKVTLPKIRAKTHLPFLCKIGIIPDFLLQMSVQLNFLGFQSVSWCFKLPNTLRLKIKHHAKVSLMINSKFACSLNLYLFS